eukprot:scaffold183921_cov19-Tisochrysis_lutea.AAC.1
MQGQCKHASTTNVQGDQDRHTFGRPPTKKSCQYGKLAAEKQQLGTPCNWSAQQILPWPAQAPAGSPQGALSTIYPGCVPQSAQQHPAGRLHACLLVKLGTLLRTKGLSTLAAGAAQPSGARHGKSDGSPNTASHKLRWVTVYECHTTQWATDTVH